MIRLIGSDGFDYGEVELELASGEVLLSPRQETEIWGNESRKLNQAIEHMEALQSRTIHWSGGGSGPTLEDGTPLTDEIMLAWGWEKIEDGSWKVRDSWPR